jgi:hypothetical protein
MECVHRLGGFELRSFPPVLRQVHLQDGRHGSGYSKNAISYETWYFLSIMASTHLGGFEHRGATQ